MAEIKSGKSTFYNLVVAQAFRIDASPPASRSFLHQPEKRQEPIDDQKAWLQQMAEKLAGKPVPVTLAPWTPRRAAASVPHLATPRRRASREDTDELKAEAMANSTVQAVLEIFPVEKTTVEERLMIFRT